MSAELNELRKISKMLSLINAKALEIELAKYASTNERKKAWILIDGKKLPEEIGENAGMKLRTIQDFLKLLVDGDLIESSRGKPPVKLLDYVPASWLDLVKTGDEKSL